MTFREGSNRHQDLGSEQAPASPGYQDGRTNIMFNLLQNKEGMDQTRDPEKGVVLFFPRLIQRQLARIWKGHPGKWPWPPESLGCHWSLFKVPAVSKKACELGATRALVSDKVHWLPI